MNRDKLSQESGIQNLRIFVYGTLMRGCRNYNRYCRGALQIQEVKVRGRLYEFTSGIPALRVPGEDVLAHGTSDPLADVATQERFHEQSISQSNPIPTVAQPNRWYLVPGELLSFAGPASRLPDIDRLEGFRPGGSSFYKRVLVLARGEHKTMLTAWTYVAGNLLRKQLCNN